MRNATSDEIEGKSSEKSNPKEDDNDSAKGDDNDNGKGDENGDMERKDINPGEIETKTKNAAVNADTRNASDFRGKLKDIPQRIWKSARRLDLELPELESELDSDSESESESELPNSPTLSRSRSDEEEDGLTSDASSLYSEEDDRCSDGGFAGIGAKFKTAPGVDIDSYTNANTDTTTAYTDRKAGAGRGVATGAGRDAATGANGDGGQYTSSGVLHGNDLRARRTNSAFREDRRSKRIPLQSKSIDRSQEASTSASRSKGKSSEKSTDKPRRRNNSSNRRNSSTRGHRNILRRASKTARGMFPYLPKLRAKTTITKWLVSSFVCFLLAYTYLFGVVYAARVSVFWEFLLTLFLPMVCFIYFYEPPEHEATTKFPRQTQLIIIESFFNVLTICTKLSILYFDCAGNTFWNWCFMIFFALQTWGFYQTEVSSKRWWGVLRSGTLWANIILQRRHLVPLAANIYSANVIDEDGRFLVWGANAPPVVILNYFFWLLGVLFVDYAAYLPYSMLQAFHLASFFLSWRSGEFWHVRLLTACHLFVLDAIVYFKHGTTLGHGSFARMPSRIERKYRNRIIPAFQILSTLGCLSCLSSIYCGQEKLWCYFGPWSSVSGSQPEWEETINASSFYKNLQSSS